MMHALRGALHARGRTPGPDAMTPGARRYGYYFASSAGVRVSQRVKKVITIVQLVQVTPWQAHFTRALCKQLA